MYLDPTYFIFVLPTLILAFWAQFKVKRAYAKWTQVRNYRDITGFQAAQPSARSTRGAGRPSASALAAKAASHDGRPGAAAA